MTTHETTATVRESVTAPAPSGVVPPSGRGLRRQRVLLIDDHPLFAESLELALSRAGYEVRRAEVPASPGRSANLLAQVSRSRPGIVLLDLDLGQFGDGARLVPSLVQSGCAVVVVTADQDRARWGQCLAQGARKTISKTAQLNEILAVLRRIDSGLPVLAPGERDDLLRVWQERRAQHQHVRARLEQLTVRESQVLGNLTHGRTVREIAATSYVSEATVRTQVKSILAKLGVSSQLAAVGLAHQVGWQSPVD
ncbi:response regulator transcription factor [Nocardioides sp. YIM 152315]|uniref:response regulator n=1 Tax=Nocardioides sp. YIM 152315 TaxID=3031760 RepID=UPI0023DB76F8|nr:response regulator transcription factor [Nocardioides sp. YIM 152315]MDF1603571.1 response regulator transcription factor [Nocardioides sp. YIM 152315]